MLARPPNLSLSRSAESRKKAKIVCSRLPSEAQLSDKENKDIHARIDSIALAAQGLAC